MILVSLGSRFVYMTNEFHELLSEALKIVIQFSTTYLCEKDYRRSIKKKKTK